MKDTYLKEVANTECVSHWFPLVINTLGLG